VFRFFINVLASSSGLADQETNWAVSRVAVDFWSNAHYLSGRVFGDFVPSRILSPVFATDLYRILFVCLSLCRAGLLIYFNVLVCAGR